MKIIWTYDYYKIKNQYTFMKAIEHGNLENIDWLIENGCPYDNYSLMGNKDLM